MTHPDNRTGALSSKAPDREQVVRKSIPADQLALLFLYALALAGYFVLRYATYWAEGDTSNITRAIESVQSQGTLLPYRGVVYPNGYGYQAVAQVLISATGLSTQAVQTVVWPLLSGLGLALTAYVFYAKISGDRRVAILAGLFLLLQPDVLFVTFRGSHEKLTWPLILVALTLLYHSIGRPLSVLVIDTILFYLTVFAVTSINVFFASTFIVDVALSLVLGVVSFRLSRRRPSAVRPSLLPPDLRRLIYIVFSCAIILFLFAVYFYPPALHYILQLDRIRDQLGATILSFETVGQPYEYITYGWTSSGVYLGLTLFTWLLILSSFVEWVRRGIDILRRRQEFSLRSSFDWLLYAGFAIQVGASIAVDYAGVLSQNLQLRIFPGFTIMAALLLARGVRRLLSSSRQDPGPRLGSWARRLAMGALVLACGWFAVASVLKATNEPLLSNKWTFYSPPEDGAIGWTEEHVHWSRIWTGVDERLWALFSMKYRSASQSQNTYTAFTLDAGEPYVLLSEREQLRALRMGVTLPLVDDWQRVYDNGDAYLYHRRPLTPYQR